MMTSLDDLAESCYEPETKPFIKEAIACYRAGSYRATVILTWEAIVFDLFSKIKAVAMTGNKAAKSLNEQIFNVRNDPPQAQRVESEILNKVTEFEFFDQHQRQDLERLKDDRNRCAHPSLTADRTPFQPSPEMARMHLRNAVAHLISQPPVQGKSAMKWLLADLTSPYFPDKWEEAKSHLQRSPLRKAKKSLVRDFLLVQLKEALGLTKKSGVSQGRLLSAIRAVQEIHPTISSHILESDLDGLIERVRRKLGENSNSLNAADVWGRVFQVVRALPGSFDYLERTGAFLKAHLKNHEDRDRAGVLNFALDIAPLASLARKEVGNLDDFDFFVLAGQRPERWLIEMTLDKVRNAKNWGYIGAAGRYVLVPYMGLLTSEDIAHVIESARVNEQVSKSFDFETVADAFHAAGRLGEAERNWLANGWERGSSKYLEPASEN